MAKAKLDVADITTTADVVPAEHPVPVLGGGHVHFGNLGEATTHVRLEDGSDLRLGPKEIVELAASQITDAIRRAVAAGHFVLHAR